MNKNIDISNLANHEGNNNIKKPWKQLTLRELVIHLLLSLFGFGSSNFDTWSDFALGYSYVEGATYLYHFSNQTDPELLMVP